MTFGEKQVDSINNMILYYYVTFPLVAIYWLFCWQQAYRQINA